MSELKNDQTETPESFALAIDQHRSTPANLDQSLARISTQAHKVAATDTNLLLVPEASLTGYNMDLKTAQAVAVSRSSATTENIQSLCQQCGIAIAYGYIERDADTLFNSVQVIDSSGDSIAHYRKNHLWGELDQRLFTAGSGFSPVFQLAGWQLGILICYDIEFPESVRHLALQGAELILAPTALMQPWTFVAEHMTRVRAAENQLYFAYANFCDSEGDIDYVGHSCIVGPDGDDLARAGTGPELIQATLTRQAILDIRTSLPYHRDRRPELYTLN